MAMQVFYYGDYLKKLPHYKAIVKACLWKQIHEMIEELYMEVGEELLVLSTNLEQGTVTHQGTDGARHFLQGRDIIKKEFIAFCKDQWLNKEPTLNTARVQQKSTGKSTAVQKKSTGKSTTVQQKSSKKPATVQQKPIQKAKKRDATSRDKPDNSPVPDTLSKPARKNVPALDETKTATEKDKAQDNVGVATDQPTPAKQPKQSTVATTNATKPSTGNDIVQDIAEESSDKLSKSALATPNEATAATEDDSIADNDEEMSDNLVSAEQTRKTFLASLSLNESSPAAKEIDVNNEAENMSENTPPSEKPITPAPSIFSESSTASGDGIAKNEAEKVSDHPSPSIQPSADTPAPMDLKKTKTSLEDDSVKDTDVAIPTSTDLNESKTSKEVDTVKDTVAVLPTLTDLNKAKTSTEYDIVKDTDAVTLTSTDLNQTKTSGDDNTVKDAATPVSTNLNGSKTPTEDNAVIDAVQQDPNQASPPELLRNITPATMQPGTIASPISVEESSTDIGDENVKNKVGIPSDQPSSAEQKSETTAAVKEQNDSQRDTENKVIQGKIDKSSNHPTPTKEATKETPAIENTLDTKATSGDDIATDEGAETSDILSSSEQETKSKPSAKPLIDTKSDTESEYLKAKDKKLADQTTSAKLKTNSTVATKQFGGTKVSTGDDKVKDKAEKPSHAASSTKSPKKATPTTEPVGTTASASSEDYIIVKPFSKQAPKKSTYYKRKHHLKPLEPIKDTPATSKRDTAGVQIGIYDDSERYNALSDPEKQVERELMMKQHKVLLQELRSIIDTAKQGPIGLPSTQLPEKSNLVVSNLQGPITARTGTLGQSTQVVTQLPGQTTPFAPQLPGKPIPIVTQLPRQAGPITLQLQGKPTSVAAQLPGMSTPITFQVQGRPTSVSTQLPGVSTPITFQLQRKPSPVAAQMPGMSTPITFQLQGKPTSVATQLPGVSMPVANQLQGKTTQVSTQLQGKAIPVTSHLQGMTTAGTSQLPGKTTLVTTQLKGMTTPVTRTFKLPRKSTTVTTVQGATRVNPVTVTASAGPSPACLFLEQDTGLSQLQSKTTPVTTSSLDAPRVIGHVISSDPGKNPPSGAVLAQLPKTPIAISTMKDGKRTVIGSGILKYSPEHGYCRLESLTPFTNDDQTSTSTNPNDITTPQTSVAESSKNTAPKQSGVSKDNSNEVQQEAEAVQTIGSSGNVPEKELQAKQSANQDRTAMNVEPDDSQPSTVLWYNQSFLEPESKEHGGTSNQDQDTSPPEDTFSPEPASPQSLKPTQSKTDDLPTMDPQSQAGYEPELTGPQHPVPPPGTVQLFLGNFPHGTRESELRTILEPFGVTDLTMMNGKMKNRSTYAFATCCDRAHAENAIATMDQGIFRGRRLTLALANPDSQVPPPPPLRATPLGQTRTASASTSSPQVPTSSSLVASRLTPQESSLNPTHPFRKSGRKIFTCSICGKNNLQSSISLKLHEESHSRTKWVSLKEEGQESEGDGEEENEEKGGTGAETAEMGEDGEEMRGGEEDAEEGGGEQPVDDGNTPPEPSTSNTHKKVKYGDRDIPPCVICGRIFPKPSKLIRHLEVYISRRKAKTLGMKHSVVPDIMKNWEAKREEVYEKATQQIESIKTSQRTTLSVEERVNIIKDYESGDFSMPELAAKYNRHFQTIFLLLNKRRKSMPMRDFKPKQAVKKSRKGIPQGKRPFKPRPTCKYININRLTYDWLCNMLKNKENVTLKMIKDKARSIAEEINETEFKASNGWLYGFKKRYKIVTASGKSNSTAGTKSGKKTGKAVPETSSMAADDEVYTASRLTVLGQDSTSSFPLSIVSTNLTAAGGKVGSSYSSIDSTSYSQFVSKDGNAPRVITVRKTITAPASRSVGSFGFSPMRSGSLSSATQHQRPASQAGNVVYVQRSETLGNVSDMGVVNTQGYSSMELDVGSQMTGGLDRGQMDVGTAGTSMGDSDILVVQWEDVNTSPDETSTAVKHIYL